MTSGIHGEGKDMNPSKYATIDAKVKKANEKSNADLILLISFLKKLFQYLSALDIESLIGGVTH